MEIRKSILGGVLCMLLSFAFNTVQAQDIQGTWKGKLSVQGTEVPLVFHIEENDGKLEAKMDSPSQGATGIPLSQVESSENIYKK